MKQKGQSTVEFAFIVPLFMCIVLGMIYGGILFMDYLQYNNDARAIAREVAFMPDANFLQTGALKDEEKAKLETKYFSNRTDMYTATLQPPKKIPEDTEKFSVEVRITFALNGTWGLTKFIGFPPATLNDIVYIMPVEKAAEDSN